MKSNDNESVAHATSGGELRVSLDLGDVVLSPEELLQLRPGSSLQLPRENTLAGLLRLNGFPWARVSVTISDSSLDLEVTELVLPKGLREGEK